MNLGIRVSDSCSVFLRNILVAYSFFFTSDLWFFVEWIDFPRCDQSLPDGKFVPGNNNSFDKCRRRFDLV